MQQSAARVWPRWKKKYWGMGILRTGGIGKYFFQQLSK